MITPQEFAAAIHELNNPRFIQADKARESIEKFIKTATATQLRTGMRLVTEVTGLTMGYFQNAMDASNLRFQEESSQAAERHIKQTEELNRLTSSHIEHTKTLTKQTDILVKESKGLRSLSRHLLWLTVVLAMLTAGLLYLDWNKEHKAQPETTAVYYPVTQILTNLDSTAITLDAAPMPGSLTIKAESPTNPAITFRFSHYYVSNNIVVLDKAPFELWHSILKTTNVQMRIIINYTKNVRGQE